ncbi:TPA: hypothetical protein ACHHBJ_002765 [Staphylococcus aureus]
MGERYLGSKILSWVYLVLIFLVYVFVYIYITSDMSKEHSTIQSSILVIITSFIGTYSKQFYESMLYMIYNFEPDKVPKEINRIILKSFAMANFSTLMLLSVFILNLLKNQVSIFLLIVIIAMPFLLYIIALFFKFTDSED